jgi:short-subunit dehydrogenase
VSPQLQQIKKTWFITGASSGIGRLVTELLLERGHHVAATLRQVERLNPLAERYPELLRSYELDVREPQAISECVHTAIGDFGQIDVVLSNAGYGLFGAAEELSDDQITNQLATNLLGPIHLARAFLPNMRARRSGHFLQMSSMGGVLAVPGLSMYHVTKWGVEAFFDSVGAEVESFGIAVTLVEPGIIRNDFHKGIVRASPMAEYAQNSAMLGLTRGDIPQDQMIGDPRKIVEAIINVTERPHPPRRLLLGSDAYQWVHTALVDRLKAVEAQRDMAGRTDITV